MKQHHRSAPELWVGYYRKDSGRPTLSRSEAIDEALCFGWIDGVGKKIDDVSYTIRFTPRKTRQWSAVNIRRARALIAAGRMQPAGLKAFDARDKKKSGYSMADRATSALSPEAEKRFKANSAAWAFFEGLPPGYRRNHIWFVQSAKRPETRERRLENLIKACAKRIRLDPMRPLSEQL